MSSPSAPVSRTTAWVLLASTIVIGAFTLTMVKVALDELSALGLATGRVVVSAAMFAIVVSINRRRRAKSGPVAPVERRPGDRIRILCIGLAGSAGFHLIASWGMQHVSIAVSAVVMATMPALTAAGEVVFLRHRLSVPQTSGVVLSIVGCSVIGLASGSDGETTWMGIGAIAIGTVLWAGVTVTTRGIGDRYDSWWINTPGTLLGAAIVLAIDAPHLNEFAHLSWKGWLLVLWLGSASSAYYYFAMAKAMTAISATTAAALSTVVTPTSIVVGWMLLGDAPSLVEVVGGAVVIGGALLVVRDS